MTDKLSIKTSTIIWIILGVSFIVWLFWPTDTYTTFSFELEDTGKYIEGKVFFDDTFMGDTEKGEIKIYFGNLSYEEIIFKGIYNREEYIAYYEFPKDYWEYSDVPFGVSEEYILEYINDIRDNFNHTNELHWGHMPLTYMFENECIERQINLTELAFEKIELETGGVVYFKEISANPDISIFCKPREWSRDEDTTLADADYEIHTSNENLIIHAEINFYGQGMICLTGYPALEVHEILHTFGIEHNPLTKSIMHPYSAESSNRCKITKIDEEYISCLRYIYSNGEFNGNCSFSNYYL